MSTFLILLVPLLLLWFLILRPAQKRQRETAELRRSITPGQDIVTVAGMVGTVLEVEDDEIVVSIAPGVEVRMVKGAVAQVRPAPADEPSQGADPDEEHDAATAELASTAADGPAAVPEPRADEGTGDTDAGAAGPAGPAGPADGGSAPRPS